MQYQPEAQPQFGMAQPPPAPVTTVVVSMQPQSAINSQMLAPLQGNRAWSTGMFDCFSDIPNCK